LFLVAAASAPQFGRGEMRRPLRNASTVRQAFQTSVLFFSQRRVTRNETKRRIEENLEFRVSCFVNRPHERLRHELPEFNAIEGDSRPVVVFSLLVPRAGLDVAL